MTRRHRTVVIWPENAGDMIVVGELVDVSALIMGDQDLSHLVGPDGAAVRINFGTLVKAIAHMVLRLHGDGGDDGETLETKNEQSH